MVLLHDKPDAADGITRCLTRHAICTHQHRYFTLHRYPTLRTPEIVHFTPTHTLLWRSALTGWLSGTATSAIFTLFPKTPSKTKNCTTAKCWDLPSAHSLVQSAQPVYFPACSMLFPSLPLSLLRSAFCHGPQPCCRQLLATNDTSFTCSQDQSFIFHFFHLV
jgi:hypothetical protein